jgi:activating signal cointegrator 1
MGGQTKLPLETARKVAEKLLKVLEPHCEQIAIAGSIRRNKPEVGDIELVAIPKLVGEASQASLFGEATPVGKTVSLLDQALDQQFAAKRIRRDPPSDWDTTSAWGEKQKKFWLGSKAHGWMQVDLFIVRPPAQWGAIFAIRTGSSDFNLAMMRYINRRTSWKQDDGHLKHRDTGEVADTPTEEAYFGALGLPVIPPHERREAKLYEIVRALDATKPEPQKEPDNPTIKALTLHQPWASLIAAGIKQYETRHWSTDHRGLLAIHAGKKEPDMSYSDLGLIRTKNDGLPEPPPLGCVVAIARLVAVIPSRELVDEEGINALEMRLGNFKPGRYGWKLEVVKVFDKPIPARGQQGLWDWDGWDGVIDEVPAPAPPPEAGQQEILSTCIKRQLAKIPGLHKTVLIPRLGCTVQEFDLAISALKSPSINTVKERLGCYWLTPDYPYASAQPVEPAIQADTAQLENGDLPYEAIVSFVLKALGDGAKSLTELLRYIKIQRKDWTPGLNLGPVLHKMVDESLIVQNGVKGKRITYSLPKPQIVPDAQTRAIIFSMLDARLAAAMPVSAAA